MEKKMVTESTMLADTGTYTPIEAVIAELKYYLSKGYTTFNVDIVGNDIEFSVARKRLETDEEFEKRVMKRDNYRKYVETEERKQLVALKAKYEAQS